MHQLGRKQTVSKIEDLKTMNSVNIVEEFWERVWKARNPAAIDDFVIEDFVITTGSVDVVSRTKFKEWAAAFMAKINDLQFEVIETFQNEDGSRVASRWRIAGKNNGILGTRADQQPISFTGTAVWAVREDGKLCHNWVERSAFELFQQGLNAARLSCSNNCAIRVQQWAAFDITRSITRSSVRKRRLRRDVCVVRQPGREADDTPRG